MNTPQICNLCKQQFLKSACTFKCKCSKAYCFTCTHKIYQREKAVHTIRLVCSHSIQTAELIRILRKTCPLCFKSVGKLYYELDDGTCIDAPCYEFTKNKSSISISKCISCKNDIGISWMKEAVAPAPSYSHKQPLCAVCYKNGSLPVRLEQKCSKKYECASCRRIFYIKEQITDAPPLCIHCKQNQLKYYEKKANDPNFCPDAFGSDCLRCYRCKQMFIISELKKNHQTGKMCCLDCDKAYEREAQSKERLNSIDDFNTGKSLQTKSQLMYINKNQLIQSQVNQKIVVKQRTCNVFKSSQPRFHPKQFQEPQPADPLYRFHNAESSKPTCFNFIEIKLQEIQKCQKCLLYLPPNIPVQFQPDTSSSPMTRTNRFQSSTARLCLQCCILQINLKKQKKKQIKRAQTQQAVRGKKAAETDLLPDKLLAESSKAEKESVKKETKSIYYAVENNNSFNQSEKKPSLVYSSSLRQSLHQSRVRDKNATDNLMTEQYGLQFIKARFSGKPDKNKESQLKLQKFKSRAQGSRINCSSIFEFSQRLQEQQHKPDKYSKLVQ